MNYVDNDRIGSCKRAWVPALAFLNQNSQLFELSITQLFFLLLTSLNPKISIFISNFFSTISFCPQ